VALSPNRIGEKRKSVIKKEEGTLKGKGIVLFEAPCDVNYQ